MNEILNNYDYTNLTKSLEEKIKAEKRRRHQIYTLLDYTLSMTTYFDFFSKDTFQIIQNGKCFAKASQSKKFTNEFLLVPFLESEFEISKILKEHNFNQTEVGKFISKSNKFSFRSLNERKDYFFYNLFKNFINFSIAEKRFIEPNLKNSYELSKLFEKTAENAFLRFKTPVITPEILFITMMEMKDSTIGKIIRKFFKTETDWYLLRYKLIKTIHAQEICVRTDIKKNEQYFAYLLKINLSEFEFNRLVETKLLDLGVSTFRNRLIRRMLSFNLFDLLEEDIHDSIKITNKRKYSN